jgi:hypothetical protein
VKVTASSSQVLMVLSVTVPLPVRVSTVIAPPPLATVSSPRWML